MNHPRVKYSVFCIAGLLLVCLMTGSGLAENMVGVLSLQGEATPQGFKQFGYPAIIITPEMLNSNGLSTVGCLIVNFENSFLAADEYQAIRDYVGRGGNLLLVGLPGYWLVHTKGDAQQRMKDPKKQSVGNAFSEVAGARVGSPYPGIVKTLGAVAVHPLTDGIPDVFEPEPAKGSAETGFNCTVLAATGAVIMVQCEAYQKKLTPDNKLEYDMQTPAVYGGLLLYQPPGARGKCVWLTVSNSGQTGLVRKMWENALKYLMQ